MITFLHIIEVFIRKRKTSGKKIRGLRNSPLIFCVICLSFTEIIIQLEPLDFLHYSTRPQQQVTQKPQRHEHHCGLFFTEPSHGSGWDSIHPTAWETLQIPESPDFGKSNLSGHHRTQQKQTGLHFLIVFSFQATGCISSSTTPSGSLK